VTTNHLDLFVDGGDNQGSQDHPKRRVHVSARERTTSVWPSQRAIETLGGKKGTILNTAIECWATLMRQHRGLLKPRQLTLLAEAINERPLDPQDLRIGQTLAAMVRDRWGELATAEAVATVLERMDYAQAWACIWAAKFTEGKE
jgi:hypothetical protein